MAPLYQWLRLTRIRWLSLVVVTCAATCAVFVFARPVTVVEVIDGDTVRLRDGEVVRLLGIDTPEHGEPFFTEATAYLAERIDGREVDLTFDYTRRDHYHRLLGYLWLGDSLINLQIVRNGLARVYAWPPDTLYYRRLVSSQTAARGEHRGIWSIPAPAPESLYVIHAARFRFHRPDCVSARPDDERSCLTRDSLLDLGLSACRTCRP